jgi:BlaI family transcriptional regulator, penicillinase repressor
MTTSHLSLSRRERQIMDLLYRKGRATALEVLESLADAPSYSAVRALLRVLETKGHVKHERSGARYVFVPTVNREKAKKSAVRHLIQTFFDGSPEQAMTTLLDVSSAKLSAEEFDRLADLIAKAREGAK